MSCMYQNYDWGKIGRLSEVYKLINIDDSLPPDACYAELWMGDHPNCPSKVHSEKYIFLHELIKDNGFCLGDKQLESNLKLPFLFKVLSIEHALSIQVHPNKASSIFLLDHLVKEQAEILHKNYPDIYKDPNHKPELAIALTDFEALIGFRFLYQIRWFFAHIPHLREFLPADLTDFLLPNCKHPLFWYKEFETLKRLYTIVMTTPQEKVDTITKRMYDAMKSISIDQILHPKEDNIDLSMEELISIIKLFLRLFEKFQCDVGTVSVFFLHFITLKPGESIFLAAGTVHAYISGDCVECMASSDNVVRAGLTPKLKDVNTLLEIVKFESMPIKDLRFIPVEHKILTSNANIECKRFEFSPPIEDFAVERFLAEECVGNFTLPPVSSASIILFIEGEGKLIRITNDEPYPEVKKTLCFKKGSIFFLYASEVIQVQTTFDCNFKTQKVQFFRARANLNQML